MSWLVNSLATSLHLDDDDEDHFPQPTNTTTFPPDNLNIPPDDDDDDDDEIRTPRGVKEDLSELSDTLTRQFWGVASFLAPPPQIPHPHPQLDPSDSHFQQDDAVQVSQFQDSQGNFEAEYSSNVELFQMGEQLSVQDYTRRGVVGVTEEVVAFARNIALHPETWIDFPLPDDDVDDDYELSDAQQEHALAIERLAPELAALRIELCLSYMSESCFWKIYFALVHPRLSRHDAEILSTPEIVKAREMLSQELHGHVKPKPYECSNAYDSTMLSHEEHCSVPVVDQSEYVPHERSAVGPTSFAEADVVMEKHAIVSTEIPVVDKRVVEEVPLKLTNNEKPKSIISKIIHQYEEDDADDWLEEVNTEADTLKGKYLPGDYEDISFSDLEDDEDVPSNFENIGHPNHKVSTDNLRSKESNDWLDIKEY